MKDPEFHNELPSCVHRRISAAVHSFQQVKTLLYVIMIIILKKILLFFLVFFFFSLHMYFILERYYFKAIKNHRARRFELQNSEVLQ
jgi:hypothetical protein